MNHVRSTFLQTRQSIRVATGVALGMVTGFATVAAPSIELPLPPRIAQMESGTEFARRVSALSRAEREAEIEQAILKGNIPNRLRRFRLVRLPAQGKDGRAVTIFVSPDYLSVGSDEDWLWVPISPVMAQKIADRLDCVLPTPRMVDAVYHAAKVKLPPRTLPPGPSMTTMAM